MYVFASFCRVVPKLFQKVFANFASMQVKNLSVAIYLLRDIAHKGVPVETGIEWAKSSNLKKLLDSSSKLDVAEAINSAMRRQGALDLLFHP